MPDFDANDPQAIAEFIRANISRHKHLVLATIDDEGKPWTVCVNLSYDERFNIVWKSAKAAEHSRHIEKRPDVAICIFSEDESVGDFGLYLKALAHEVTDPEELDRLIGVRFSSKGKPAPDPSELSGDSPVRLYCAEATEAWVNDNRHLKMLVDLDVLRSAA